MTGSRADFGLMLPVLNKIVQSDAFNLRLCVTAMHLSKQHGDTIADIYAAGFSIMAEIPVNLGGQLGGMSTAIGHEIIAMTEVFAQNKIDAVVLLGDRGEMLAAAIAASHLNIPIVHLHGGERTGSVDEMVRHCISKLAHYHFTATKASRERLIRMGENPAQVFVSGAPGLDCLDEISYDSRDVLCENYGMDANKSIALLVYHPVVQEYLSMHDEYVEVIESALENNLQLLCLTPNADTGGREILRALAPYASRGDVSIVKHLKREEYLSWMRAADVMLGNSSSGIIEAASFNLPVVNIGCRQNLREQSDNVINVLPDRLQLSLAISKALSSQGTVYHNIYGDGRAAQCIVSRLKTIDFSTCQLNKSNEY